MRNFSEALSVGILHVLLAQALPRPVLRTLIWCRWQIEGGGYAGVRDVTQTPAVNDDSMPSFWLAETLKYAWLVFSPADALDLDALVLNTEAHPLRVLGRPAADQVRETVTES